MLTSRVRGCLRVAIAVLVLALVDSPAFAQGLGGAGTVQGTVKDPTGGVMQVVQVRISNPVSGFSRTAATDATGRYVFIESDLAGRRAVDGGHHRCRSGRVRRQEQPGCAHCDEVRTRPGKAELYNFLSTFSGTHFVTPRAYQLQLGVTF